MSRCPCGSEQIYDACCGRYIDLGQIAATPEALMRSRYTAYTLGRIEYIARTMKAPANIDFNAEEAAKWAASVKWMRLEVMKTAIEGNRGFVEFVAHFKAGSHINTIHEKSEFRRDDGEWFYIDGLQIPENQQVKVVGRNDPCPCGSGKKYKKCCLTT